MLQKRLDYGCNGYHVPFVPRAARSTRRRRSVQKKVGEIPLCAFDLLATVAGEILLESENDHNTTLGTDYINVPDVVMDKDDKGDLSLVVENCGQARMETASPHLTLELGIRGLDQDLNVKGIPESLPDCLKKNGSLSKIDLNGDSCCHSGEIEGLSLGLIDTRLPFVVEDAKHGVGEGERLFVNGNDLHSIEDPEVFDGKSPSAVSSDGSVKLTLGIDHYPCSSQLPSRVNNVNLVSRDDDENSSECIQPSTTKTVRSPACIGDRRIRKLLESKYRRMASRARDGDVTDTEVRCLYRSRKMGYKRLRSQRIYPLKKRRFSHYSSFANSHADIGYKGVCNYPDKVVDANASGFGSVGVNGSSVAGQNKSFSSRESQVKLRIKSFRVPELFIEMPETATVGSLKRTVMEAVSALLGGGLRVGVLLQEKKIRDDNKTLIQSGICHNNKVESLGFSLEPNPSPVGASVCAKEENSLLLSIDAPQPISRCPIATSIQQGTSHLSADHLVANLGNFIESDNDSAPSPAESSAPSPADLSAGKGMVESHALAALPNGTPQALAVGHSHHKSKSSDMGQRRIRRPFSVSEVEALVQAVEKLGTGRWRDVKLRAFDNVKHRTYVDLKDKWKTLVHTARIAPQQRRGEPVPQVLLDRVLAAHAYWTQVTQHQSNQELVPPSETGLLP